MRDEWLNPKDDPRPVIGECAECRCDIHDSTFGYESDFYYDFDGDMVCEDCLEDYCRRNFGKGGI